MALKKNFVFDPGANNPLMDIRPAMERKEGWVVDAYPIIGTKEKFHNFLNKAGLINKVQTNTDLAVATSQGEKTGESINTPYDMLDWLKNLARRPKPPPPPPEYAYDVESDRQWMKDWVDRNEGNITKWVSDRPNLPYNYEDLRHAVHNDDIMLRPIPKDEWTAHKIKSGINKRAGGWYANLVGDVKGGVINYPEGSFKGTSRGGIAPHEIMHFFAGHVPSSTTGAHRNVPDINPYQALDKKLGGWLPSFHPGGRRPWSMKSPDTYHPHFDEGAYSRASGWDDPSHPWSRESQFNKWKKNWVEKHAPARLLNSAHQNFNRWKEKTFPPPYKPPDTAWMDDDFTFNKAFDSARSSGLKTFHWRGKEYTTKVK